jgi:RNA polymerase sigma factor (sigma-70 family)
MSLWDAPSGRLRLTRPALRLSGSPLAWGAARLNACNAWSCATNTWYGLEESCRGGQAPVTGMDREAFTALYRDHVGRVTSFATRRLFSPGEVADLVAATFLVALERSDSYDPARGDSAAWLLGIAANLLANQRRRAMREQLARARLDARALLSTDDVEALVARMDASAEASRLRAAMQTLSDPYREVLFLAGESSLSPAAAAKAAGISPATFRVRLSRARRALRRAMESQPASPQVGEGGTTIKEALT